MTLRAGTTSIASVLLGLCTAFAPDAVAQTASPSATALSYPSRPIVFVVPFSPGTGQDMIARILAQRFTDRWGQGGVVDNKAGASGNIGSEIVARAPPDGYTLLATATSFVTNAAINSNLRYDPVKSFIPVSLVALGTMSLVVSTNTPAQSVKEFVSLAKANPGELNYASSGNGTPQHLTMELFKLDSGIVITHIPYKGTAPAIADLTGGRVNAFFLPVHTALHYVQQGRMRMLAVLASERTPLLPNVPTMSEAGYPGVQVENWYGVLAPAGTPREIVAKLNAEISAFLAVPEGREILAKQGLTPVGGPPSLLADMIQSELRRWPRVVSAAGIRAD
jgi:tripartite-type tricarboxylate transporter receptor subunit TctC